MSISTPHPPLPKQPLGRTFLVAISLLGLLAVVQLLAVVLHFIPMLRQQIAATAVPVQPEQQLPYRPQIAATPAQPAVQQGSVADGQLVKQLIAEADRRIRVEGDFDEALKLIKQAENIIPGDPKVLILKSLVLEKLNQPAEAAEALAMAMEVPGLDAQTRASMERKISQLNQLVGPEGLTSTPAIADGNQSQALTENGVPPGSSLGIVDVRLRDSKVDEKALRVAIKSRPGSNIEAKDVELRVFFYEQAEDGNVELTESRIPWQWQSQPINWADDLPEIVQMLYQVPPVDPGGFGRKYYGYIVGIYYRGELQDFRSDPAKLARDFPLPFDLKPTQQ